jgi:hypothetical protein
MIRRVLLFALCGAIVTMTARADLVGLWTFDEGSGTTATDKSGNGYNGKVNKATWVAGKYGGAVGLNGTDANVEVAHGAKLSVEKFSVMAWINVPAKTGNWQTIVTQNTDGPTRNYGIFINNAAGQIHYSFTSGKAWQSFDAKSGVIDGKWHHIAATYDGANFRCYVDGKLDAETPNNKKPDTATTVITIGSWVGGGFLKGSIDEVALYNHALTADDLSKVMTGLSTPVEPQGKAAMAWAALKTSR